MVPVLGGQVCTPHLDSGAQSILQKLVVRMTCTVGGSGDALAIVIYANVLDTLATVSNTSD